ncbi:MAG: GAF domain-containing sensor histidine kinase [Candidatus Sericytochromatia bacterium]|nr:GAF domain-containing sensor histidine kinase [Candidatus Sericytochromatia bacterium]
MASSIAQALLHALADQLILLDPAGHVTQPSGLPLLESESFESRFSPEICRMFRNAQQWVNQTGQTQVVEYPVPGGHWQEASIHPVPDVPGHVVVLIKDIQRRKEAEIALLRFQEGLTTLNQISFAPELAAHQQIQQGLELMCRYFQLPYGLLVQRTSPVRLLNFSGPEGFVYPALPLVLPSPEPLGEVICQAKGVTVLQQVASPFQSTLLPPEQRVHCLAGMQIDVENQLFGYICFFDTAPYPRSFAPYDTEFMRIFARWLGFLLEQERQIARLQTSIQNKNRIMEIIAHDLRNPIGAVIGLGEFSLKVGQVDSASQLYQALSGMVSASKRANRLLEVMLNADQLESGKQTIHTLPMNLSHLLQQVLAEHAPAAAAKKIRLLQQAPEQAMAAIDIHWFSLALDNLLNNALKYTPAEGCISVELVPHDTVWELRVRDTGIGIPPEWHERIFEKFTTAKRPGLAHEVGTGLGLHLTRQIIQRHGGEICLDSQVDAGTCFYVHLPRLSQTP